ncbi:alpha/beta hydrolase [Billgrantia saliphila]|uniref:alpha/beta hydrolase n=1 Tax=Billgrantia saliphila TaxID=1848458 RepID=UPI000CE4FC06|nr:alpha/beta hydrolase [Halomonas saliphila]
MSDTLAPPVLQPSRSSPTGDSMPAHCCVSVTVLIEHRDTLGRPLPAGTEVELCDIGRQTYRARIDADGISRHEGVTPGKVAWQLLGREGQHLVAVDDVPCDPRWAAAAPPECDVAADETSLRAVYLPPPIGINLREEAAPEASDRLSDEQLEQLRLAGNNATLFLHGYNVAYGSYRHFAGWEQRDGVTDRPLLVPSGSARVATIRQDTDGLTIPLPPGPGRNHAISPFSANPEQVEGMINGSGAHNWYVHMEYRLNRAAGMTDDDWRPYTRIVGIAWPGDTGAVDFFQAELNAMAAGRRLVALLAQLHDAGIAINVISHSLGARVILTALNILGEQGQRQVLDNLYLWQPAVADNALVDDPSQDSHPLGMGVFPEAHKAVRKVVVLHSQEDGILGPPRSETPDFWQRIRDRITTPLQLGRWVGGVVLANDQVDELIGSAGGAYGKKWWVFPIGLAGPITQYYVDKAPAHTVRPPIPSQPPAGPDPYGRERAARGWQAFRELAIQEARDALASGEALPTYRLLAPLAHHAVISEASAARYIDSLEALVKRQWRAGKTPRAALGHIGFGAVRVENRFIERKLGDKAYDFVDQTSWLFDHSGMRIPSDEIFEKSYQEGVVRPLIRDSGFGDYEPI